MPPRCRWALLHSSSTGIEQQAGLENRWRHQQCWLPARGYSRCAAHPVSWLLAALQTSHNDLVPLLQEPQVPTGTLHRMAGLEGTSADHRHKAADSQQGKSRASPPRIPFRLNPPPATDSNHLPSTPVHGNWSVPCAWDTPSHPPTWGGSSSLKGKLFSNSGGWSQLPPSLKNSVTQAARTEAGNSNSSPTV